MKLLAVDDDESIRTLLPMILEQAGYPEAEAVGSASEALEALDAANQPFDGLLLDIQMPRTNGIELCRKIRQLPDYAATPILMLTAMHDRPFIEDAFAAGATDYITKPFDMDDVRLRLRRVDPAVQDTAPPAQAETTRTPALGALLANTATRGVISRQAMANYVQQLSRSGLEATRFFAVKLAGADALYHRMERQDYVYALQQVCDAIVSAARVDGVILSYCGEGIFVCQSHQRSGEGTRGLESRIQEDLDSRDLTDELGVPLDLEVSVGAAVTAEVNAADPFIRLEERVIKRAVAREEERLNQPHPPNIRTLDNM